MIAVAVEAVVVVMAVIVNGEMLVASLEPLLRRCFPSPCVPCSVVSPPSRPVFLGAVSIAAHSPLRSGGTLAKLLMFPFPGR